MRHRLMLGMGLLALSGAMAAAGEPQAAAQPKHDQQAQTAAYTLSGPYTHKNLTIYLIHGKDVIKGKQFLTLQEALEQKKLIIHETSNVNQLTVENVSKDAEVFIQAGDIVKGGRQDRVLSYDLIVAAKSGKVPIAVFCVEHGRWQQRGHEDVANFSTSRKQAPNGKEFKLAVQQARNQSAVWRKVQEAQMKLSKNVGQSVAGKVSPSSLELTLEDKKLLQAIDHYVKDLATAPAENKHVIGYALVINGQIEGADVYGSAALFRKLWPKLLEASAINALAELQKDQKVQPVKAEAVKAFLADAGNSKTQQQDLTSRVRIVTQDSDQKLLIETRDQASKGAAIHRSHVKK